MIDINHFNRTLDSETYFWANKSLEIISQHYTTTSDITMDWIYRNIHLGNRGTMQSGFKDNHALLSHLKRIFSNTFLQNGWHIIKGNLISPEGIPIDPEKKIPTSQIQHPQLIPFALPGWHLAVSPAGIPAENRVRFYIPALYTSTCILLFATNIRLANLEWVIKFRSSVRDNRPDRVVLYVNYSDWIIVHDELQTLFNTMTLNPVSNELPLFCWKFGSYIGAAPDISTDTTHSLGQELSGILFKYIRATPDIFISPNNNDVMFSAKETLGILFSTHFQI